MPARNDVQREIKHARQNAQDVVRRRYLKELADYTKRDTIFYGTAFGSKKLANIPPYVFSINIEDVQGFMSAMVGLRGESLDLILHSPGGSLEAADQIVQYLRQKYKHIRAIIPLNAMSAATMIACACEEIYLGKQSALGPIDPQITVPSANGQFSVAAQSILDEFDRAKVEVMADPRVAPLWVTKMKDFPPGLLSVCQNTLELSVEKVGTWLSLYMFRETENGEAKSKQIAAWLGNARKHKTHGRPIGLSLAREIGLNIKELESDQRLQEHALSFFHAAAVTFEETPCVKIIENHDGKGWYLTANQPNQR